MGILSRGHRKVHLCFLPFWIIIFNVSDWRTLCQKKEETFTREKMEGGKPVMLNRTMKMAGYSMAIFMPGHTVKPGRSRETLCLLVMEWTHNI